AQGLSAPCLRPLNLNPNNGRQTMSEPRNKFDGVFPGIDDLEILVDDEKEPVVAYTNEFKGVTYFHIRKLYVDRRDGEWKLGKGLSVRDDERDALFDALSDSNFFYQNMAPRADAAA